ncbi:MAG: hypothetical protein WC556_00005, partial [Candidatus Methanoperedens sp.]
MDLKKWIFVKFPISTSPLSHSSLGVWRRLGEDARRSVIIRSMSSRAHSPPFDEVIAPRLYYEPPHRTGLEDFPHPALQKHIL